MTMTNNANRIYVAGHRGMVGSAIARQLLAAGHALDNIITRTLAELDLTNQAAVRAFFQTEKPDQVYLAAAKVTDNAPDKTRFAAMAKRLATDTGSSVADRALQLHGGYGYLMDYPIERFWRDLRVHSILEGTNQVMRMITAREMLRQ